MEGSPLVARHSIDEEDVHDLSYGVGDEGNGAFSSALLEPNVHDVMSMELAHHDMGGYLDPRSFGGGTLGFDDYSSTSSLYDVNSSFGDEISIEQKGIFSNDGVSFPQVNTNPPVKAAVRMEHQPPPVQPSKLENTVRYDPPRNVPTYPVKTADPSTCTQYAPVRTLLSSSMKSHGASSRRTTSRSTQKKEAIDPKRVEDEVARNVSQILSATKQQRLAMEAQQRSGSVAPQPQRIAYACPDCHKTVTSARNLQARNRHRQTCTARGNNGSGVMAIPSSSVPSSVAMCPVSTSVMISPTSSYSNLSYSNYNLSTDDQHYTEWSRSNSYSAPQSVSSQHDRCLNEPADQLGTLDPNSISCRLEDACLQPLSLDLDEPRALSSSGSTSSASTGTHSTGAVFMCESCKKSVSSLRSLKRHHTTCKQYIAENGPPAESDHSSPSQSDISPSNSGDVITPAMVNSSVAGLSRAAPSRVHLPKRIAAVPTVISDPHRTDPCAKAPPQLPLVTSSSCRCSLSDCVCTPSTSPQQSVSCIPKMAGNNNTCEDCNRQLCSASNLKRHRATCKIVMQKQYSKSGGMVSPVSKPMQQQKWQSVEIAARERMIIDRSYAAALAASQEAHQHAHQPQSQVMGRTSENSGAFVIVQDQGIVGERPWITVGEHLRAQHMQQKVLEAQSLQNQTTTASSGLPPTDQRYDTEESQKSEANEMESDELHGSEEMGEEKFRTQDAGHLERKPSVNSYKCTNMISRLPMTSQQSSVPRCSSTVEQKPIFDAKTGGAGCQTTQRTSTPITPLESIITTQPLPSERLNTSFGAPRELGERRSSDAIQTSVPTVTSGGLLSSSRQPAPLTSEFQCPECMKTYSCRKNVKRHRMAVHKLSAEEVSRPMSAAQSVGSLGDSPPLSQQLGQQIANQMPLRRSEYKPDGHAISPQQHIIQQPRYQDRVTNSWLNPQQMQHSPLEMRWSRSREYMAEIEGKKPRTELAEADTTFHEESDSGSSIMHDSTRMQSLATSVAGQQQNAAVLHAHSTLSSWVEQKQAPSSHETPHGSRSSSTVQSNLSAGRTNKRPPHVCIDCNRVLSSDYSLRRHRLTCIEARNNSANQSSTSSGGTNSNASTLSEDSVHLQDVMLGSACIGNERATESMGISDPMLSHVALSTPLHHQGVPFNRTTSLSGSGTSSAVDEWYERHSLRKTDDVPDSTTSQRLDRSTSPGILTTPENSQPGCLQYTRKRANSGNSSAPNDNQVRPQQHKHLCQSCGKFYSSEWNLERHRRESCPVKGKGPSPAQEPADNAVNDETSVQVGHTLFLLSRSALSRASAYFAQLFAMHDPSKGELRLELDPTHFQSLLDVYNNPSNLNQGNIDAVVVLANRLKFSTVFDSCERYIAEQLPQVSVMHAIRLAEQLKLSSIKQRLFDTISIDVFRSLASDEQYKKMDAELKAELLEKWGTTSISVVKPWRIVRLMWVIGHEHDGILCAVLVSITLILAITVAGVVWWWFLKDNTTRALGTTIRSLSD
ncbi:hypothetical protein Q1695_011921 [Nippostrongylus brasiliensis]|nr:hypothetical protein Q1695_011921 [Nippostrongylus brasiliensis]